MGEGVISGKKMYLKFFLRFRCEVRGEEIQTPVCVTVTDQEVDEYCKDVAPDVNCYDRRCSQSPKVINKLLLTRYVEIMN